jgi:hypothetical protein
MIIIWADRLAALHPAQSTLLGVLLMVAVGLTLVYIKAIEGGGEDVQPFGDD